MNHGCQIISKITITLFIFISVALTACQSIAVTPTPAASPSGQPSATASPTPTRAASMPTPETASPSLVPVKGGMINFGLVGRPQTLNPIAENHPALRELSSLLFNTLLRIDPESARLQPGLAQSWKFSDDGQRVTFDLPPDLKWSDGSPLTAAGIAESLQATQHPALLAFSKISAADEQTLTFDFLSIDCGALTTLSLLPLLPASQILAPRPVGSGPFVATGDSESQTTLTLTRNPNYPGPAPFLDGLNVRFIDESELDIALSEGQFDAVGPLRVDALPQATGGDLRDIVYPAPQVIYIAINFDPRDVPPLLPAARQALLQALDREAILAEALNGDGQLVAGSLLPGHWAANGALSPPPYNPAAARALLAGAGLVDTNFDGWLDWEGQRVEISIRLNGKNPLHQRLGWLASSYYRDLGLFARAEGVGPDSLIDDLFTHDFQLALFSWLILPDPDQRLYWRSDENTEGVGLNFNSYANAQLDSLLEQGVAVPGCQPEDRAEIYAQAQEILSQDRPVDFLLAPNRHWLVSPRLQGFRPGPFAPFTWNIEEWFIQE